jgi:hypothetical protein
MGRQSRRSGGSNIRATTDLHLLHRSRKSVSSNVAISRCTLPATLRPHLTASDRITPLSHRRVTGSRESQRVPTVPSHIAHGLVPPWIPSSGTSARRPPSQQHSLVSKNFRLRQNSSLQLPWNKQWLPLPPTDSRSCCVCHEASLTAPWNVKRHLYSFCVALLSLIILKWHFAYSKVSNIHFLCKTPQLSESS